MRHIAATAAVLAGVEHAHVDTGRAQHDANRYRFVGDQIDRIAKTAGDSISAIVQRVEGQGQLAALRFRYVAKANFAALDWRRNVERLLVLLGACDCQMGGRDASKVAT
jgi:hypothetical protein